MRSTVLRLERRIQQEHADALVALQDRYDELILAILEAARQAGYLGAEPMGAVAHLGAPRSAEARLGRLIGELWTVFFQGFRPDEASHEEQRFREQVAHLQERMAALNGESPDQALAAEMLEALIALWDERQDGLSARLDQLIGELGSHQQALGSADLERAYRSDEHERCQLAVGAALGELGESSPDEEPLPSRLARLIRRFRSELAIRRDESEARRASQAAFLEALAAAAAGDAAAAQRPGLATPVLRIVREIAGLVDTVRRQDRALRRHAEELATARAQLAQLEQEVESRDERLARYEIGELARHDADQRLPLYRQALAALRAGETPTALLEQLRDLERVLVLPAKEEEEARRLVDSHLDDLARRLTDLRRCLPLSEDPRRYRPRLFGSGPYRLKSLHGTVQALRDAARDLQQYAGRARWARGLESLIADLGRLRRIFKEMVVLVATARERAGGAPPASMTLSLDDANGLTGLPTLLAADLHGLLRCRGAARAAPAVIDLLEETVAALHQALERARGDGIERQAVPKREGPTKAVGRLADELLGLGAALEAWFGDAKRAGWRLSDDEQRLVAAEPSMLAGLRSLEGACDVLAVLPGAPTTEFPKLPSGRRSDLDRLVSGCQSRVTWLEELASWRFEQRSG